MTEERRRKSIKTHDGASPSSSTPPQGSEYQVFLNFRGADTRLNFTDHLYTYLTDVGVQTFRDDEELRVGEKIGPDLMKAIEESSISIPIFSENYASSKWCLRELTHMVKCMNDKDPEGRRRHTVWPVFYGVTPANVKHQTGSFEEAFLKHAEDEVERTIQEWKDALTEVAELKGWEKDKIADGHEAKLVKIIVNKVCRKLRKSYVSLTDNLVGMDHHIDKMTQLLDINGDNGVRIVGIHGMGGIGKTTIAKSMYNQLCDHFQPECSFLEDVREKVKRNGYAELRKQLVHGVLKREVDSNDIERSAFKSKKVLIVLDDVEDKSQLKEIIGSRDYFGPGSRIIVTTRNKEVFEEWEGDKSYEPSGMNNDESLFLFCKHAFKSTQPQEGYGEISRQLAKTAAGLPLSLKVIGSMLFKKEKKKWEAALKKLKTIPADDVQKRLKISYDTLSNNNKQMFLDIACHFIGKDITNAVYMWEDCGFHPDDCEGIDVLVSLSLITIQKYYDVFYGRMAVDVFGMHDQLRDLGRDIVKQENPIIALERSRLVWSAKEAVDGLKNQRGINKVETLHINYVYEGGRYFNGFSNDDFKGMSNLRYLRLPVDLEGDFNRLLPELRWFRWRAFARLTAVTNFCPQKLVILDLSDSDISDGWEKQFQPLGNLKVLNLSQCSILTMTPDFSKFSNLERLILRYCDELIEIGSSVKHLKRLTYFSATGCYRLRRFHLEGSKVQKLPGVGIEMLQKLEELDCSRCESLEGALPSEIGRLSSLRVLDLSRTKVDTLPDDVRNLGNLRKLHLKGSKVKKLPGMGIERLQKLEELDCGACSSLVGEVPEGIWRLSSLRHLDLNGTKLTGALPKDISGMSRLETLDLGSCEKLRLPTQGLKLPISLTTLVLPFTKTALDSDSLRSLVNLRLLVFEGNDGCCCEPAAGVADHHDNSNNNNDGTPLLPITIDMPSNLEYLRLVGVCDHTKIKSCRLLPAMKFDSSSRLHNLAIEGFQDALLPGSIDLSNCQMLRELRIKHCNKMREIADFGNSLGSSWVSIDIRGCDSLEVLPSFSTLKGLKTLTIEGCPKLREIKGPEEVLTSLEELTIEFCYSLEVLPNFSTLKGLQYLKIGGCPKLRVIKGPEEVLTSLKVLTIGNCDSLEMLPNFSTLKGLKTLEIGICPKLREIKGPEEVLTSLEELAIGYCDSLEVLPNFSTLKGLKTLAIGMCPKLCEIKGLEEVLTSLEELFIGYCDSLEVLPNFSTLKGLKTLKIRRCPKLREIKGLEEVLTSLEALTIEYCPHLKEEELHPDVLNSETLRITFEQRPDEVATSDDELDAY